jgi:predicted nucleic acid-binding protein
MKQVVCNSSPIIALSSIKQLKLLSELFDCIHVPHAVYQEITKGSGSEAEARQLEFELQASPYHHYNVINREAVSQLYGKLHLGEIEVVMAAKELSVAEVLLDDLLARKLAQTLLLQPLGTLGVLMLAKKELAGTPSKDGYDSNEWPMAIFVVGGTGRTSNTYRRLTIAEPDRGSTIRLSSIRMVRE